jgi:hypothetical protein
LEKSVEFDEDGEEVKSPLKKRAHDPKKVLASCTQQVHMFIEMIVFAL